MAELKPDTAIKYLQENPKRKDSVSYKRYEKYKVATTVQEAMQLGSLKGDIAHDKKAGFLTVCQPVGVEQLRPEPGVAVVPEPKSDGKRDAESPGSRPDHDAAVAPRPAAKRRDAQSPGSRLDGDADVAVTPRPAAKRRVAPPAAARKEQLEAPEEAQEREAKRRRVEEEEVPQASQSPSSLSQAASASQVASVPVPSQQKPKEAVDLSFATLENKPLKFVKRCMGEARKLLSADGLKDAETGGYKFELLDRANLAKWTVKLDFATVDAESALAKDFVKFGLETSVDLEISIPDGFPLEPPFVRVVYPLLRGGYVFNGGGLCFEPLTKKGWVPSMTLASLAVAIRGILEYGDVRVVGVGERATRTVREYTEQAARKDHSYISAAHKGGEGSTYGALNRYSS